MRRLLSSAAVAALVLSLAAFAAGPESRTSSPTRDPQKVVVHLSHYTDDLHAGFMAFKVANALGKRGAEVTMFIDLEGARIAHRHNDLSLRWGEGDMTLGQLFQQFMKTGGKMIVCPHCAHHFEVNCDTVRDGVTIGTEDQIAEVMLEASKVIDY